MGSNAKAGKQQKQQARVASPLTNPSPAISPKNVTSKSKSKEVRPSNASVQTVKLTETDSAALTAADWVHCVGMTLLYTCQGLVQATTFLLPLSFLHINKGFSKESIGLLGLPGYAFSFKFVWAPVVDLLWSRAVCPPLSSVVAADGVTTPRRAFAHRRLQWTIAMQLGIFLALAYLYQLSTDTVSVPLQNTDGKTSDVTAVVSMWELIANNQRSVIDVLIALFALSFFNATQDIAVDAWAVEGLSTKKAGHAGTLQFIGLTIGMTLYSLFTNMYTSDSAAFPVSLYFYLVGAVSLVSALVAVVTSIFAPLWIEPASEESPSKTEESSALESVSGTVKEIINFLKTPSVRNVVLYLLSRGFFDSSNALISVEMMALGWTSTSNTATISLISTVVQLLSATIITPCVMKRLLKKSSTSSAKKVGSGKQEDAAASGSTLPSLRVMRSAIPYICAINGFTYVFFAAVASLGIRAADITSFDAPFWYLWGIQVPQTVVLSVLRSSVFMCACAQFAKEAARVANLTGTAVTILNSIANMGYALPSSFVMLSSERLMHLLMGKGADSVRWAIASGLFSITVGALLLYYVTIPAIRRLEDSSAAEEGRAREAQQKKKAE